MFHFSAISSARAELRDLLVAVARLPARASSENGVSWPYGLTGEHRAHDRDLAHVLHAAGDDEVGGARHHALRGEVDGLLRRTALAVDGGAGHVLGEAGDQPAGAGDVAGLRADAVDVAEDDVVDRAGVDAGALDERLDRVRAEIGRVDLREPAAAPPDRRADRVDDVGLGHHGRSSGPSLRSSLYLLTITDEP